MERIKDALDGQKIYIDQILKDTLDRINARQVPLIVQTTTIEFTGNYQFYPIMQCSPDSLSNVKNLINQSFRQSQELTTRIEQAKVKMTKI
jgi:hypothetical protein